MRAIYFDPFLGASGDMIIASLLDLGVDVSYLEHKIGSIGLRRFRIIVKDVKRQSIAAKLVNFRCESKIKPNRFIAVLKRGNLSKYVKENSIRIIQRIFDAETRAHRQKNLHLHELADIDTIIDALGSLLAIEYLKVDEVYTGKIKAGRGLIKTAHGNMPAFNFATAHLLKGMPVEFLPIDFELTTPTAAAIISTIARPTNCYFFDKILGIGHGAGSTEIKGYPNIMRTFLGETNTGYLDTVTLLETNLDDHDPQVFEYLFDRLFEAGALDVYLIPTIQKKSRPGIMLGVIAKTTDVSGITEIIFSETSTLGIRISEIKRRVLPRQIRKLKTKFGPVRYKIAKLAGKTKVSVEYEDIKKIARRYAIPLSQVKRTILKLIDKNS